MASIPLNQARIEEQLVFYSLSCSYLVYFFGSLYLLGSVIGWLIAGILLCRGLLKAPKRGDAHVLNKVSPILWAWVLGMFVMLLALIVGHDDYQLGFGATLKSTFGWAKGWALLALFPLLGGLANIRSEFIVRGCCIAAASAIPFTVIGMFIYLAGLNGDLYMSPLKVLGGPLEVFQIRLFGINPETHLPRWQFIAPWAPAAGLVASLYLLLALQEKDLGWRNAGVMGAVCMCLFCQSRAGWALFLLMPAIILSLKYLKNPWVWVATGLFIPTVILLGEPILDWLFDRYAQVRDSRPGSTRVRGLLAEIAIERWQNEAPIWGHGVVEAGPKIVEHMPIGSHHSWYGLLYVKGIVGLLALAVPLLLSLIYLFYLSFSEARARTAFAIYIILFAYSFFENLEILSYLYWPALLWVGQVFRPKQTSSI